MYGMGRPGCNPAAGPTMKSVMQRTVLGIAFSAQAPRVRPLAWALLSLCAWLCAGCASGPASPRGPDAVLLEQALDAGELAALVEAWRAQPDATALRRCVLHRLQPRDPGSAADPDAPDDWPRDDAGLPASALAAAAAFADAWRGQLLGVLARDEAEERLARSLAGVSIEQRAGLPEAIEPSLLGAALTRSLATEGVQAFVARRDGLLDLLLWRTDERRTYDVRVPDGRAEVQVRLLDGVLVHGARAWASCDAPAVHGGVMTAWRDGTQLLLPLAGTDTDSETFRAHVLAREAQRQWDGQHLPPLDDAERHYRAALAELARVESDGYARAALARLVAAARRGRGEPEAHAAWAVAQALGQLLGIAPESAAAWAGVRANSLQASAASLLRASTSAAIAVIDGERVHFLPD